MRIEIEDLLHPRLMDECLKLFSDGHYKHAAIEAMQSVELALREAGVPLAHSFGARMIQKTFGDSGHILLSLELGEKLQGAAAQLFEGAFSFYRNYAAHDGRRIDKQLSMRIMVLASELLDFIGASRRSFTAVGGLDGLLAHGFFHTPAGVARCLRFLDGNSFSDIAMDAFLEQQAEVGVSDKQIEVVVELGLVAAHGAVGRDEFDDTEIIFTTFALSDLGKNVLEESESLAADNAC